MWSGSLNLKMDDGRMKVTVVKGIECIHEKILYIGRQERVLK